MPTTICPDCGLEVRADNKGFPAKHVRLAVEAGLKDAACVRRRHDQEQRRQARRKERARWERDYRALKERRADRDSTLPKHLR